MGRETFYRREVDWSLGAGEGLGSLSDWGRPVLVVDPEGPMRAGRRAALGVGNSRRNSRTAGGGVWKRERWDLLRRAECPWHPDQSREVGGQLNEVGDVGRQGRQLPLPDR